MSQTLKNMKKRYLMCKNNEFVWHDYYPNNILKNGKEGIFTYYWEKDENEWSFHKFSITYKYRVDEEFICYPEEGVRYYVLYDLLETYPKQFNIPGPTDNDSPFSEDKQDPDLFDDIVNSMGTMICIFDDEETAKKAAVKRMLISNSMYSYILSEEEIQEWRDFMCSQDPEYAEEYQRIKELRESNDFDDDPDPDFE